MKLAIFNKKMILAISGALLLAAVSCKSTPVVIDKTMTAQELIQNGQDAAQNSKYNDALTYYQAVINMYGNNTADYIEARYEIGHLYMKKKNYKAAQPIFEEIQEIFRNSLPGTLPAAYNKLADIELAKIPHTKQALAAQAAKDAAAKETLSPDEY